MTKKILVVDYSVLRQQMYRLVMSRYHCTVVNAMNGKDALALLAEQQDIGIILLDINIVMAGMSGIEFLEKASELGIIPRVPVILISAFGKEEETLRSMALGVKETLIRPFNPSMLHEMIERISSLEKEGTQEGEKVMSHPARYDVAEKIFWHGELTQSMSLQLGGELLSALKEFDTLTVNLEKVEILDYSCLVLLCAVKRQASEKGKDIILEGQNNPAVAPLLQRFRVNGNRLCRAYCGNSCLFD